MTLTENSSSCEANWPTLSGTVVPGGYEVGDILEAEAKRARFRLRVLGDWSANAFLDVFLAADQAAAEEQVALWSAAKELKHLNLSSPLSAGQLEHEGAHLVYLVARSADENLAGVLRERALTVEEVRDILTSLRRSLEHLHGRGWIHGHLAPEHIFAVGDAIEISTEYAGRTNTARPMHLADPKYTAPEAAGENTTNAADIWCLGATLFEALTQKVFSVERQAELANLPPPFNRVAERCLDPNPQTRCALRELGDLIAGRRTPLAAETAPPAALPKRESVPVLTRVRPEEEHPRSSKLWIYAVAAVLFVLLMLWAARPRHQYQAVTAPVTPPHTNTAATKRPPAPSPSREVRPLTRAPQLPQVSPTPSGAVAETRPTPPGPPTINGPVWHVIVFTYAREADAENKAHSINNRHPNLDAKVFSPSGQGSPYLVTVGGKMTKEEAARLRQRAVGLGLPHDSYIQNYKQ